MTGKKKQKTDFPNHTFFFEDDLLCANLRLTALELFTAVYLEAVGERHKSRNAPLSLAAPVA